MDVDVLTAAVEAAKKNNISTIVVASTTGNTANKLFDIMKLEKLRLIVVTHDEGRVLTERRFNENIRQILLANKITVYTHNPPLFLLCKIIEKISRKLGLSHWYKYLREIQEKYGTGIKVCHIILQMLIEGNVIKDGSVIAVAGRRSGADSIGVFLISSRNKWPKLQEVVISHNN